MNTECIPPQYVKACHETWVEIENGVRAIRAAVESNVLPAVSTALYAKVFTMCRSVMRAKLHRYNYNS